MQSVVRVGVGVFVRSASHPECVLLGKRLNSHGHNKFALPGGHLELNETFAECAMREVKEETNLDIHNLQFVHVTNDRNIDGKPEKHYITIFMSGDIKEDSAPLSNMEPHKCGGWEFTPWSTVLDMYATSTTPPINQVLLFDPLLNFIADGKSPI